MFDKPGTGILLGVVFFSSGVLADWSAPDTHPIERYAHIWQSSPFVVATEITPGSEALANRFALTGAARIGESDIIFIIDRQTLKRFPVAQGKTENGVELVAIQRSDNIRQLSATIRSGGEMAEIRYASDMPDISEAAVQTQQPARTRPQAVLAANNVISEMHDATGVESAEEEPPARRRVIPRRRISPAPKP